MKKAFFAYLPRLLLTAATALALGLLLSAAVPLQAVPARAASPGSAADPLVTQEWVEDYVERSFAPLNLRLEQLEQKLGFRIVLTIGSQQAYVNGQTVQIPAPPQLLGAGYTMVPARFIGEALGLTVDWDAVSRKVTFSGQGQSITLTIDRTTASINGQAYAMPFAPVIKDGHTLVHARFVSEAFNCQVNWDPDTRQVTITK